MTKYKGLGKGLDVLFAAAQIKNNDTLQQDSTSVINLNLNSIVAGKYQPRNKFNEIELKELSDSILQNGVLQPIIVRKISETQYEIIAGERRFRASKLANKSDIPVIIKDYTDKESLAISLIENIQRQDLNIVEEAIGYRRLASEFNLTHDELAKITAKSRSNISNTLRILNLSSTVLDMLSNGLIDMGHARAILSLDDDSQVKLANRIINEKLTTYQVEKIVNQLKNRFTSIEDTTSIKKDVNITKLESELSDKLAMTVYLKHKKNGGGKLELIYQNLDELDYFLNIINFKEGI